MKVSKVINDTSHWEASHSVHELQKMQKLFFYLLYFLNHKTPKSLKFFLKWTGRLIMQCALSVLEGLNML